MRHSSRLALLATVSVTVLPWWTAGCGATQNGDGAGVLGVLAACGG